MGAGLCHLRKGESPALAPKVLVSTQLEDADAGCALHLFFFVSVTFFKQFLHHSFAAQHRFNKMKFFAFIGVFRLKNNRFFTSRLLFFLLVGQLARPQDVLPPRHLFCHDFHQQIFSFKKNDITTLNFIISPSCIPLFTQ